MLSEIGGIIHSTFAFIIIDDVLIEILGINNENT
jgi:hypothetical protein